MGGAWAKTPCLIGYESCQSAPLCPGSAHIHAGCQLAGRGGAATSGRVWGGRRRKRKGRAAAAAAEAEAEAAGGCSVAAAATALFRVDDGQPGQEGGGVRQRHRVCEVWICRLQLSRTHLSSFGWKTYYQINHQSGKH